jgi:hypothetical protein
MDGHRQVSYDAIMRSPRPLTPTTSRPGDTDTAPDCLPGLCAEFPAFRIWREDICGTTHYVACRQQPGQHPYAVITPDPGRLRAALQPPPGP